MKISKETLEEEVQNYNEIVEEIQKVNLTLNELEQKRLKSFGKLEFIEGYLKEENEDNLEQTEIK